MNAFLLSHLDFGEEKYSSSTLGHILSLCVMINEATDSESL